MVPETLKGRSCLHFFAARGEEFRRSFAKIKGSGCSPFVFQSCQGDFHFPHLQLFELSDKRWDHLEHIAHDPVVGNLERWAHQGSCLWPQLSLQTASRPNAELPLKCRRLYIVWGIQFSQSAPPGGGMKSSLHPQQRGWLQQPRLKLQQAPKGA